ncbi:MAG: hypothetical protein AAGF95_24570 [Chloroflexota bacterium]
MSNATITVTLTEQEVQRLIHIAQDYDTTPEAIIQAFAADFVDSEFSGGTNERMYANMWFEQNCAPPSTHVYIDNKIDPQGASLFFSVLFKRYRK